MPPVAIFRPSETMYVHPPRFITRLFPSLRWGFDPDEYAGRVFLTFDDGPTPGVTPWIVETLGKFGAKATFFCLGKNVEQYPELYRLIVDEGHVVGNHTYSHMKGWGTSPERYIEDVDLADSFIRSNLVRPPYGRITPSQARRLSERYNIIMWDVLSRDYSRILSPAACLDNVTRHMRSGSVVVFHDSLKAFRNMSYALPRTLEHAASMSLRCEPIVL